MVSPRVYRVAEEMKREIAQILRDDIKDPRIGFVTVTGVELSSDLRYTKVFVSVLGDEETQKQSLEALQKASGFIRREIGQRIKLRFTPEIAFKFDTSIEHGDKIARLLSQFDASGKDKA